MVGGYEGIVRGIFSKAGASESIYPALGVYVYNILKHVSPPKKTPLAAVDLLLQWSGHTTGSKATDMFVVGVVKD